MWVRKRSEERRAGDLLTWAETIMEAIAEPRGMVHERALSG